MKADECYVVGDAVWDPPAARRAKMLSIGLLSGGYGTDELLSAGAFRVYDDAAALHRSLDDSASTPDPEVRHTVVYGDTMERTQVYLGTDNSSSSTASPLRPALPAPSSCAVLSGALSDGRRRLTSSWRSTPARARGMAVSSPEANTSTRFAAVSTSASGASGE